MLTKVSIYTDGSARGNPDGPGGYGTIIVFVDSKGQEHIREYSAGYKKTTNNRMELMAAIVGLEALTKPCHVTLYSDSQYLVKAFNEHWIEGWIKKGWKRGKNEPVKMLTYGSGFLRLWSPIRWILSGLKAIAVILKTNDVIPWPLRQPTEQIS